MGRDKSFQGNARQPHHFTGFYVLVALLLRGCHYIVYQKVYHEGILSTNHQGRTLWT